MPSALFVTTIPITLEAFLLPFADHFRRQGWRIDALSNGSTRVPLLAEHFDKRYDAAWSRNPLAPANLLGTASGVREIVSANAYDIVHVHTPIAAFVTRYALRGLHRAPAGPSVVYTAHGFHFYRGQPALPHAVFRTMERVATPWTDFLVTINREDFSAALSLGGIDPEHVRYIPGIGVDTARFSPEAPGREDAARIRAELGAGPEDFLAVMVAEFSAVKRHAFALDAIAAVADPRVKVALIGNGPLEADVRARVERLGLDNRVRFAGYRRDLPTVLRASDALMLVSEREGLNRSVLEAMACGTPVIGTATRGITDAVGDEAGWIVGHSDAAALARAIDAAAADANDVARRGAAARERVCTEFALEKTLAAYDGLYREALASRL